MVENRRPGDSAQTRSGDFSPSTGYPPQSGLDDVQAEQLTFPRHHVSLALKEDEEARYGLLNRLGAGLHVLFSRIQQDPHETIKLHTEIILLINLPGAGLHAEPVVREIPAE